MPRTKRALVGVHEIEEIFGLNRMQVYRLIQGEDLPEPAGELRGGRVWYEDEFRHAIEHLREIGRINDSGAIVPWRFVNGGRPRRRRKTAVGA